ncbi:MULTISPECIES: DUF6392 family protein [Tenebrionibacter/Tenebrionicola group]|jgi:hypothetical protein|uniref:Pyocin immunity protein n=2 Tax=Tenebrionibacter/Tenebrionicola group TaxID=2969848 RepID=A0A8K0V895_9ENTR|nr:MULTISPECIES: DUF6392 family protein [Tenebrionibacter/Tenebrionicola group]MBK4717178.1 pyocin immunity protein [Tenebrionibacter intestinalis]MBV5097389.1 pyocin immunity protein [Tenebrionicola larvae]
MTVNIESLIRNLGNSYKDLIDSGIITYKSEPKGAAGSPTISLDMAKEGVFLAFRREGRILKEITLSIQNDSVKNWVFPNELPTPLQKSMSRRWVHDVFGEPEGSAPPRVVMKRAFGWVEKFTVEDFHVPITMQIDYDLNETVKEVAFILTSEMRW